MEAVRVHKVVEKDGEILLTGLPCKKGQQVEMIVLIEPAAMPERHLSLLVSCGTPGLSVYGKTGRTLQTAPRMPDCCENEPKDGKVKPCSCWIPM